MWSWLICSLRLSNYFLLSSNSILHFLADFNDVCNIWYLMYDIYQCTSERPEYLFWKIHFRNDNDLNLVLCFDSTPFYSCLNKKSNSVFPCEVVLQYRLQEPIKKTREKYSIRYSDSDITKANFKFNLFISLNYFWV